MINYFYKIINEKKEKIIFKIIYKLIFLNYRKKLKKKTISYFL
jgi:hypothetical protein